MYGVATELAKSSRIRCSAGSGRPRPRELKGWKLRQSIGSGHGEKPVSLHPLADRLPAADAHQLADLPR